EQARQQRRHPDDARGDAGQHLRLRPHGEGEQADHDHEENQGDGPAAALRPHQLQLAPDQRADAEAGSALAPRDHAALPCAEGFSVRVSASSIGSGVWLVATIMPPRARCPANTGSSRYTEAASSPTVGSSSSQRVAPLASTRASAARRFWPEESNRAGTSHNGAMPTARTAASTRTCASRRE